jgi:hypothetical protein
MNSTLRLAHKLSLLCGATLLLSAPRLFAEPSAAALAAFSTYAAQLESRHARQHRSPDNFLALNSATYGRLRTGELLIEDLTPPNQPADALLHHWRATAFVPSATSAAFEHLLRDFAAYPHTFAPQVLASTVLTRTPAHTLLRLRTRQHHVLTVVLDTTCDVTFAAPDTTRGYSISRSTRIDEIAPAPVSSNPDNGFLYRLNTYWSWEQRDNGLYLQIESLSLTRAIPRGLAWAVRPYLQSIPRDSLVFTLTAARTALTTIH